MHHKNVMVFDRLPSEMLLEINKRLDVFARTKFSIALPKPLKIAAAKHDKSLGLVAKAVLKGRIKSLSGSNQKFLARVPRDDPTLTVIKERIADWDIDAFRENRSVDLESLKRLSSDDISFLLQDASPEVFDMIYDNGLFATCDAPMLKIMIYNTALLEHIVRSRPDARVLIEEQLGEGGLKYVSDERSVHLLTVNFRISQEHLLAAYVYNVGNTWMDNVAALDPLLGDL